MKGYNIRQNQRLRKHGRRGRVAHADDHSCVEGQLCGERGEQRADGASARADIVPVEAEREHAKSFVTCCAAEDAAMRD